MSPSGYTLPIDIPNLQYFTSKEPFVLENGQFLPELTIGYHTFGTLNTAADNVIWVCHALTANSDVSDWWAGLFGTEKTFDPNKHFIVCANILGSCYGSTCPRSINPTTGQAYGLDFPLMTIRDLAVAHELLRQYLDIQTISLCIGGSCGGHQVLEFALLIPERIKKIALLVCAARESAWVIAIHAAQRLAIEADPSWKENQDKGGANGLKAARGMGLLSYRTIEAYRQRQTDNDGRLDNFSASSYIAYQGEKLVKRFYSQCYWFLTKALDTHHVGHGRGSMENALKSLKMPSLVLSIQSDLLIPPLEQAFLAEHLPNTQLVSIDSDFGHDGFLIETEVIGEVLENFIEKR